MRVGLITAAIATDFEDAGEATNLEVRGFGASPQLGVLSLAATLERIGVSPEVVSLDRLYYAYLGEFGSRGLQDFPQWAAPRIVSCCSDIYGFSSICSSYPLTIRIAEAVKRLQPGCTIVFGGPQASVVDLPTLAAFPFVDFVVRGEAEESLPRFLEEWSGPRRFSSVPGLSYRGPFGPVRNADAPVIEDLDALPYPAYHLTNDLAAAPYAPLELGRGCPFSCTFCSTNDFFRRKFRVKSPARMLAEMRWIASTYGLTSFELAHDMFTVDRRRVVAFCKCLIESRERFSWSCSARTDCVDQELLELMAAAGCTAMFFGIETGSKRLQRIIDKDLDPERAKVIIDVAEQLGIQTTVSLIMGFPEENFEDLRDTAAMYMHAMRHPTSSPQLNLLAPLAGTPIYSQHQHELVLEELGSEMSHQGRMQNEADRELIRNHPRIFPNFYLAPAPGLDRQYCQELREFLKFGEVRLRWLLAALHQECGGILSTFSAWRKQRVELHPDLTGGSLRHYYMQRIFPDEFVAFVRQCRAGGFATRALLDYYDALKNAEACDRALPRDGLPLRERLVPGDLPVRAPGIHVLELQSDIQDVIDALKRERPAKVEAAATFYRTEPTQAGELRLVAIQPRVALALRSCDGHHTAREFVRKLAETYEGTRQYRLGAAEGLLRGIHARGFIEYRGALRTSRKTPAARGLTAGAHTL